MDNSQKILLELDREFAFVSKEYPLLSEMLKIYWYAVLQHAKTPLCFNWSQDKGIDSGDMGQLGTYIDSRFRQC